MFALPGYDAFLGFLLIAAAVPALALITNKLVTLFPYTTLFRSRKSVV